MEIREILRSLLEKSELQDALIEAFATGTDSPEAFQPIELADHIRHARGIDVSGTPFEDLPRKLADTIQSSVIDRLPQPAPITLEDLTELAITLLAGTESSEPNDERWRNAYERFVAFAIAETEMERGGWDGFYDPGFFLGDAWELELKDGVLSFEDVVENSFGDTCHFEL